MARTIKDSTPKKDGFRIPGEFEPHKGSIIIWPEKGFAFRNGGKPAQEVAVIVANTIAEYEEMTVICSAAQYENARARLSEKVRVVEMSTNESWVQDKGAFYVINDKGEMRGVQFGFNAYGGLEEGLYFPWDLDQQFAQKLFELENIDSYDAKHFILEGGATQVDGEGTIILTEQCNLNPNRNGDMSKEEVERNCKEYLGLDKVIWLERGMLYDETDGHVDDILFFIKPGVIALSWVDDVNHPQYPVFKEAYDVLSKETDAKGRKFEIHKIHIPEVIHITEEENKGFDIAADAAPREPNQPLAVTYINGYFVNGGFLVPQFNDPRDEEAVRKLQELMPDRKVIGLPTKEWSLSGGNIHCMTMVQPRP
ncbi:MAG TPA: agmatine deiminase [Bacillus bacterium]|uniref:Putative agmatine deiminase n=1 Tax=Siminovitchia fordii TaxID=254759 RepID=A0ABQ4K2Z8_9BACI|nr:agmatine deiminase [Siminovitchia fordii]GIN19502.1 putative agmatine deiminase 1 [Siminovitchia fordii]HBZ11628.1 agmatine deiminase [Bacillus sp. (in: firmicutes)]